MKRFLVFAALLLCASLASCQCANPPDVGPVEDEQASRIEEGAPAGPSVT